MPHPNRPHWSHGLHQYRHHLPRRLSLRLRRQGRYYHALGSQRVETSLLPHRRRRNPRSGFLTQPILAVRCHVQLDHHLRSGEEEQGRRIEARVQCRREEEPGARVCEFGVECGWSNTICRLYGQSYSGMGCHVKGVKSLNECVS